MNAKARKSGFSLLELVIVVVIIGIIAAIAVPRMSRGSGGAAEKALASNLAVFRNAIDLYSAEHNGAFPTVPNIDAQLTQYSSLAGATQATKDTTYVYGPYVRKISSIPVGTKVGNSGIAAADGAGVGWIYNQTTGAITANAGAAETDSEGTKFIDY